MQIGRQVNTNDITRYVCKIGRQSEYRNLLLENMVVCVRILPAVLKEKTIHKFAASNVFDFK